MNACEKCYKLSRCFEQRGRCAEYRDIEEIREEVQAVMQSAKSSEPVSAEDGRIRQDEGDSGNQKATEGILLVSEVQEADKNEKGEIDDGWSRYFRHSTVNSVVRGRHTVHHAGNDQVGRDAAEEETGREGNHSC